MVMQIIGFISLFCRNLKLRFFTCYEKDAKLKHYDNLKKKILYTTWPYFNIDSKAEDWKNLYCLFRGMNIVYCNKSGANRTKPLLVLYRPQLIRLSRALKENCTYFCMIVLVQMCCGDQSCLEKLNWEVLRRPLYSADSIDNDWFRLVHFILEEDIKN